MEELTVLLASERRPDPDALGGIEVHVADLAAHAPAEVALYSAHLSANRLLVEAWNGSKRREIAALRIGERAAGAFDWPELESALEAAIVATSSQVLHLHSPAVAPRAVARAIDASGVRSVLTLHDHSLVSDDELVRQALSSIAERVDAAIAPSESVARAVTSAQPVLATKIRRMTWGVAPAAPLPIEGRPGPLRIAVVGVLAEVKGLSRLPELFAACRDLDIEWHLFGAREGRSLRALRRAAPDLIFHGAYRRSELGARLEKAGCELALLPSIAPESFGLVLAELAALGCPAVVSAVGAFPERIAALGAGFTFDPWKPEELRACLSSIAADRSLLIRAANVLRAQPRWTPADMARQHAKLWREVAALGPRSTISVERRSLAARRLADARPKPSLLAPAVRAVRRSNLYRNLGIRGALPEGVRARAERALSRLLQDWRGR